MPAPSHVARHRVRMAVLAAFTIGIILLFCVGLSQTGVTVPIISTSTPYTFKVDLPDAENLENAAQVQIAGAQVGTVKGLHLQNSGTFVNAAIEQDAAPLHQGVTVQVSQRTLVGEAILTIHDGKGPALRNGSTLPASAVLPPVNLGTVLRSLPPTTLKDLSSVIQTLGAGTAGTQQQTAELVDALGGLGNQGTTVLNSIASQSTDIKALAGELTTVLAALDTGQGEIQQVVQDADQITGATAGQQASLAQTIEDLPSVLTSARTATSSLTQVASALSPVAANLKTAAPALDVALTQLPPATAQLKNLLPVLNTTLDEAPATLKLVPATATDANELIPKAQDALQDLNPMISYVSPYIHNMIAITSLIGATLDHPDSDGFDTLAVTPIVTPTSALDPVAAPSVPNSKFDSYPLPGSLSNPQPLGDRPFQYLSPENQ